MNPILLAVGPNGVESALPYALAEARRRQRPLHLVHVLQLLAAEAYAGVYAGALETASSVLDAALTRAHELAGDGVPVTAELVDQGFVVDALVHRSRAASLVVLEHHALDRVHRLVAGSVARSVAARSAAPVVSVPAGLRPVHPELHRVVTAAVDEPAGAAPLLRTALAEAHDRGLPLAVVHASPGSEADPWRAELEPVLAPLLELHPDLPVEVRVWDLPPTEALLAAAESSELLVIARRHHLLPLGSHLGPVARAVLGHSVRPVLVAPEAEVLAR